MLGLTKTYLNVILPLKLDWEPFYYADEKQMEDIKVGTRVRVKFSGREYTGVVHKISTEYPQNLKIQQILSVETTLNAVSEDELKLWEFVKEYYMCSIGEVYKTAYPASKVAEEQTIARLKARREERKERLRASLVASRERLITRLAKKEEQITKARKDSVKEECERIRAGILEDIAKIDAALKAGSSHEEPSEDRPSLVSNIELSEAQQRAKEDIAKTFSNNKIALLNGITGSGKTEIYLSLAWEILFGPQTSEKRGNILYLVPEIALSRQLEQRLKNVFGDALMTFHSKETIAHREEVAARVREGGYMVLGTRSALFLPHHDLGLIIVDEEHDTSYKQDSPAPRYNGRDTAIMLGNIQGAKVLLGSATPSLESLYNCQTGRYERIDLSERYYDADDADIEIIDTVAERKKRGMVGSLSRKLIARIRETLANGDQVIILRGRRAYSPLVQCEECGDIPKCPRCNVTLSYHKTRESLVCHYCGFSMPFSGTCSICGGKMVPMGAGTQKIEEELSQIFPDVKIARLDSDTAQSSGYEEETIKSFENGETKILVGTQIVAKGFDFKGLALVAILQADTLMGQQDFRADERALQLLEQFRGRCGRRDEKGLFVIQTSQPDRPVYQELTGVRPETGNFLGNMLEERQVFGYPPYSRIVCIILRDSNEPRLELLSQRLARSLGEAFGIIPSIVGLPANGPVQIIGPYAPAIDRISGESIRHIRLMLRRDRSLSANKGRITQTIAAFEKSAQWTGHITIDVDPI